MSTSVLLYIMTKMTTYIYYDNIMMEKYLYYYNYKYGENIIYSPEIIGVYTINKIAANEIVL